MAENGVRAWLEGGKATAKPGNSGYGDFGADAWAEMAHAGSKFKDIKAKKVKLSKKQKRASMKAQERAFKDWIKGGGSTGGGGGGGRKHRPAGSPNGGQFF